MFFMMHLEVGAKLEATVFEIINSLAGDNGMRAQGVRNSIAIGEAIQPKDTGI